MIAVINLQHLGVDIIVEFVARYFALDAATKKFQAKLWDVQVSYSNINIS